MLFHKTYSVTHIKESPTAADLARINEIALAPLSEEQLFVGRMALCNDQYDRAHERFPESYLKRFAETIVGKAVMPGHDYKAMPLGRFFDADVAPHGKAKALVPSYYTLADDPVTAKIKAGIAKDVSIGFEPDIRTCDLCEKNYDGWMTDDDEDPCPHIAGREYDGKACTLTYGGDLSRVQAVEGSFVWMGCQPGAEAIAKDGERSTVQKAAWVLERQKPSISLPGLTRKEKSMEKQLPDKEQALDPSEKARAERLIAAGERYAAQLVKRLETRWTALDAEATGKSLAARLKDAAIEDLEAAVAEADKLFEAKFAPPTAAKTGEETPAAEETPRLGFNPLRRRVREML